MPAHSKNLTRRTSLRHTDYEDAIISKVVQVYGEAGITISANDAVRICVRRAACPHPVDEASAIQAIETHTRECPWCTPQKPGCPDGLALQSAYARVTASRPKKAPAIPPAAPEQPQAPAKRPAVRRRPLLPAPGK